MNNRLTWAVMPVTVALALTACSGGNTSQSNESTANNKPIVILDGSEPAKPLIPADTVETGGGDLVEMMFSGLVYYDKEGKLHNEIAESIEPTDKQNYTVKLKKGWKFSDGSELTSKNFINAWKLATTTSMLGSSFFSPIEGTNENGTGDLSGVKYVDDHTFTIKLKKPAKDFVARLGYVPFYPLHQSTIDDPKEGGEHPITTGPYMPDGKDAWQHKAQFSAIPNPHYSGERKPKNGGIKTLFYSKGEAAYRDLQADRLDISGIPFAQLTSFRQDFAGRFLERPSTTSTFLEIPEYVAHFSGEEGKLRRQAVSYAINRQEIADKIFMGVRMPAKEFTTPPIPGYDENIKGNEVLTYNPDKAKELWGKANAISPWSGKFVVAAATDGGSNNLLHSIANSVKNVLNIEAEPDLYPDGKALRADKVGRKIKGSTLSGWSADYPSQINYLEPKYRTGAGSNDSVYANPEFDKLLDEAQLSSDDKGFTDNLRRSQEILMVDLPSLPLWYGKQILVWSNNIKSFDVLWNGKLDYWTIDKK